MSSPAGAWQPLVAQALDWAEAHPTFEQAVADLPPHLRGRRPERFPHSIWELVEHLRRAQADLVDMMTNEGYVAPAFPDDYWPASPEPPSPEAWDDCLAAVRRDRARLAELAGRAEPHAHVAIPWAAGQTYLGAVLQAVDHAAYHIGQIVFARRQFGAWPAA